MRVPIRDLARGASSASRPCGTGNDIKLRTDATRLTSRPLGVATP